jgi:hypothetical protein
VPTVSQQISYAFSLGGPTPFAATTNRLFPKLEDPTAALAVEDRSAGQVLHLTQGASAQIARGG